MSTTGIATAGTGGAHAGGASATSSSTTTTSAATTVGSGGAASTSSASSGGGGVPPLPSNACQGYATRYWDCCKAHCGWDANVPNGVDPVTSCTQNDSPQTGDYNQPSACSSSASSRSHTCFSMAPWAVSSALSYGFAAVPPIPNADICGRCFQLQFDGTSFNAPNDPGSAAIAGKTMIVQATNIGYDVQHRQFDILVPGGGVGAFNACSAQWGTSNLGAQYGGFLTACQQQHQQHQARLSCVLQQCNSVFGAPQYADLLAGCLWFVQWYEAADNPNVDYAEVECPQAIIDVSGVDRRPLQDVAACQ